MDKTEPCSQEAHRQAETRVRTHTPRLRCDQGTQEMLLEPEQEASYLSWETVEAVLERVMPSWVLSKH